MNSALGLRLSPSLHDKRKPRFRRFTGVPFASHQPEAFWCRHRLPASGPLLYPWWVWVASLPPAGYCHSRQGSPPGPCLPPWSSLMPCVDVSNSLPSGPPNVLYHSPRSSERTLENPTKIPPGWSFPEPARRLTWNPQSRRAVRALPAHFSFHSACTPLNHAGFLGLPLTPQRGPISGLQGDSLPCVFPQQLLPLFFFSCSLRREYGSAHGCSAVA